jgi:hypothetical protein
MKKTILMITLVMASIKTLEMNAQQKGTLGKDNYDIPGNYIGGNQQIGYLYFGNDSSMTYVKQLKDTLIVSDVCYKKGELNEVVIRKILYKHPSTKIKSPVFDWVGASKLSEIQLSADAEYGNNVSFEKRFLKTHSYNDQKNKFRVKLFFSTKERGEEFYNGLKNGSSTNYSSGSPSTSNTVAKEEKTEVKINIKNATSDVLELFYQKNVGTKDNNSFRIQKGQSDDVKLCVGCSIFYNVKNSRGPLLLTATKEMDGTTKTIK